MLGASAIFPASAWLNDTGWFQLTVRDARLLRVAPRRRRQNARSRLTAAQQHVVQRLPPLQRLLRGRPVQDRREKAQSRGEKANVTKAIIVSCIALHQRCSCELYMRNRVLVIGSRPGGVVELQSPQNFKAQYGRNVNIISDPLVFLTRHLQQHSMAIRMFFIWSFC